jgi:cell shape-determining protein MreC
MLIRISLIVAIIAGLAVGGLNFFKVKKIIETTRQQRDEFHTELDRTNGVLVATQKNLKQATNELAQTKTELAATKKDLANAVAAQADLKKQIASLQDNLNTSEKNLTDAKIELDKYHAAFPTPEQALSVAKDMKALQERVDAIEDEKKILQRQNTRLQARLDIYEHPDHPVPLPATLIGKVLVADPKWDFVVLNVGEDQGALERGEMLVNRDGKLVAKIRITSVQKDRCIANVLPGWKLGEVLEGDQVIPAYPAQS